METYKKPLVATKTGETMVLNVNSLIRISAAPPDDNLQKINSQALTPRKKLAE